MFSALEARIDFDDLRVLDIYAGSGALGLEALSRGAGSLIAIEKDRKACQVVKDNMARVTGALHREVQTTALCQPAERALGTLPAASVDLAFVDPPYDFSDDALIEIARAIPMADEGIVVVERSAKNATPSWPEGLIELSAKTYGDTVVYLLSR